MFKILYRWLIGRMAHHAWNGELNTFTSNVARSSEASQAASMAANVIQAGLKDRRHICSFCFNPFEYHDRPWQMEFQMRSTLMIPDSAAMPMICDPCFDNAVFSFNRQAANIGTRNEGHSNLVLRQLH